MATGYNTTFHDVTQPATFDVTMTDNVSEGAGNTTDINLYGEAPDFLEDQNTRLLLYHLPAIIYTALMMCLGLPGNMIVFYVYFCKWRRSTSRMFILFLAALDMINCATNLPMEIYIMRYSVMLDKPFLCKLSRFSTYALNSSSALILLGIAVDRFKRICRPYQKSFSEGISKNICIGSVLFALCSTWPSLLLYGTRIIDFGEALGRSCLVQNQFDYSSYPLIFLGFMSLNTLVIFAALAVLYYFVGIQIYKHRNFKLKNCTHVQKFIEDKSVTVKSEGAKSSNDRSRPSSKENMMEKNEAEVGIVVTKESSDQHNNMLQAYNLSLPEPSMDPGTTCGLLDVPCNGMPEISSDERCTVDYSTRDISHMTIESRVISNVDQDVNDNKNVESIPVPFQKATPSPKKRKPKMKRRSRKVRYLLVRGSSTLNASQRAKCSNCLTVKIGKSTLMLFLITLAYVLSFLPFYIIVIIRQSNKAFVSTLSREGYMAYQVFLRSYLLSSAINPIIYSFCNAQFREYVRDFLQRAVTRRQQSLR